MVQEKFRDTNLQTRDVFSVIQAQLVIFIWPIVTLFTMIHARDAYLHAIYNF